MTKENTNADQLISAIIDGIEDVKGKNINILDLRDIENTVCDYFIICDGTSNTQVNAIVNSIQKKVSKETRPPFVRNCLRQLRIPSRHKINPRRKKLGLRLKQFFFVYRINFILFGCTRREDCNQDQIQKHVNKQPNRLTICWAEITENIPTSIQYGVCQQSEDR